MARQITRPHVSSKCSGPGQHYTEAWGAGAAGGRGLAWLEGPEAWDGGEPWGVPGGALWGL